MTLTIKFPATSLEDLCEALAEGESALPDEYAHAASSVITWPGRDCPWFVPGPTAGGLPVADFVIVEVCW